MNKKLILASIAIPSIILGIESTDTLNLENEKNDVKAIEAVHFEDKDLQAVLNIRYFGITGQEAWSTPITIEQMHNLTGMLQLYDFSIDSLVGLEHATNIEELLLDNNNITDITPLKDLKNLTDLTLSNNKIDLDSQEFKETLRGLVINRNNVSHISEYSFGGNITKEEVYDLSFLKRPDINSIFSINLHFTPNIKKVIGLDGINNIYALSVSNGVEIDKTANYINEVDYEETTDSILMRTNSPSIVVKYGGFYAPYGSKTYNGTLINGVYNYSVPKDEMYKGLNTFMVTSSGLHVLHLNLEDTAPNLNVDYKGDGLFSIEATDLDTGIDNIYYAKGDLDAEYFKNPDNSKITGVNFEDNIVDSNGVYTVYTVDGSGNTTIKTFEVNDIKEPEITENVEVTNKKLDLFLSVGENIHNVTNFENDIIKELEKLGVDTSQINIEAIKNVETSTNATDAQEIFNNWEMFPYNYTGNKLWEFTKATNSITSKVNPPFETGFLNKVDGMSSAFSLNVDIQYNDPKIQPVGLVFGVHENDLDKNRTDLYYLWYSGDISSKKKMLAIFKVEGQNFDFSNRLNFISSGAKTYSATPMNFHQGNKFGFYLDGQANYNYGGFPVNTPIQDGISVNHLKDTTMKTTLIAHKFLDTTEMGWFNLDLNVDGNNFVVKYNDEEVINHTDNNNPYTEGYHGIFQFSHVNPVFKNMVIKNKITKSISDILDENNWSEGSEKVIVHMEKESADYLNTEELTSNLLKDNIHLITFGTDGNEDILKNVLENNNNKGLNLDIEEYDASIASTAEYIKNLLAVAPNNPVIKSSNVNLTNNDVEISIDYHADTEFKKYKINDGEWLDYTTPFTVSENSTIYAYGANADKKSEVVEYVLNNIDKENVDNISINPDITVPTNKDVSVTLTSELNKDIYYSINDGEFIKYETPVVFTDNGHIKAYSIDKAGNVSEIKEYTVTNIDKIAPETPIVEQEVTELTNKPYDLQLVNQEDGANTLYKFNDNDWVILDADKLNITQNGEYSFKYIDQAGNESEVTTLEITNFDTENVDNITVTPDITVPTNKNVSITLTSELGGEIYYSVNDGEFIKYENPVVFEDNGVIKAYSLDNAGNVSETKEYVVSNIDKISPDKPEVLQEVTELTNKPYGLQLLNKEEDASTLYKFNNNDWVSLDTDVLNISQNGEYSFKYIDQAGNESEVTALNITNFDYDAEDFYLTKEEFTTHGDIFINLSEDFDDEIFMLVGEEYIPLDTNKVQVYENGTYTFKCVDELGNEVIKDIEVNLVSIIPSIDKLDYTTVMNTPSVFTNLVGNIENPKLDNPKDNEYYDYLLNHLAGLGQDELDKVKGSGTPSIEEVYKFATSGVLSTELGSYNGLGDIVIDNGGFNTLYGTLQELPTGSGTNTVIDLGTGYLQFLEDCGDGYIGGLTIDDINGGTSSPEYIKILNYIDCIPDEDTQNRLRDKLKAQVISLIEDCLDDIDGSGYSIIELSEIGNSFGLLDSFGGGSGLIDIGGSGSGYISGLIGGLGTDNLSIVGGQILDLINCGCLNIPDEELTRLTNEFDDKIVEIFKGELDKAKANPTDDDGLEPLMEIIKCGCMPKDTEDYLTGILEEYLKELIANTGSLEELDKLEKFFTDNGIDLTEEIEEQRAKIGLVESGGGLDTPEEPTEEDNEQPEITEDENIETDIIIPSDNGTNTNSNQVTESNKDLPQTGTEQGTNAGILLLVSGLLGGLLIRRKQNKTE